MGLNLNILLLLLISSLCAAAAEKPADPQSVPSVSYRPDVDRTVTPIVDPTANVIALAGANERRSDDLREAEARRVDQMFRAELRRIDDLRSAESHRVDEILKIRAEYDERLASAEKLRIDAIRAVDVNAVAVASQRAADQAQVLANQVVQSAEALRTLVASTASTVAGSQQQLSSTLSARITSLEQSQYEGKGKSTVTDPALKELTEQVAALVKLQASGVGKTEGGTAMWGYVVGAIGVISMLVSVGMALIKFRATPVKVV